MRLFIGGFLIFTGLLSVLSLACQKNYSVAPLTASGPGSGGAPTATPTCVSIPTPVPPTGGIYWYQGFVASGSNYGSTGTDAEVYLLVNGVPVSTAGVTVSGTGLSPTALAYGGPSTVSGTVYAWYYYQNNNLLAAGGTYTLSSATAIGTASASLSMPDYPTLASDGSGATWTGPAMYDYGTVLNSSYSTTYNTGFCPVPSSPLSVPASAYPSSGQYIFGVERINETTAITGGTGLYGVYNLVQEYLTK